MRLAVATAAAAAKRTEQNLNLNLYARNAPAIMPSRRRGVHNPKTYKALKCVAMARRFVFSHWRQGNSNGVQVKWFV